MTRPRYVLHAFAVLVALGCASATADSGLPAVNALVVKQCSGILDAVRDTRYSHTTHVIADKGVYHLDCSGFLCYFLARFSPEALAAVPIDAKYKRQRAVTFYIAFSSVPDGPKQHWRRIPRIEDALPGDFIAWREVVIPRDGNSGHCGVIWEKPTREPDGTVRVRILDSTTSGHQRDRRVDTGVTGLGFGTMWFVVNPTGEPVGYHWVSKSEPPKMRPIAVARLTTFTKPKPAESARQPGADQKKNGDKRKKPKP